MDEIKTNPPVENTTAEPPKKVRRVGTMAFAILLLNLYTRKSSDIYVFPIKQFSPRHTNHLLKR